MFAVSFLFAISLSAVVVEIDGINYEVVTKTKEATVIGKSSGSYSGAVVIPESVEYEGVSYAVASIGEQAFYYCYGLTSVTIGNSVTSIGDEAFHGCFNLTSVTIGNSVTSIGEFAFGFCSGLTSVTIGNSVTSIGDDAFIGCSKLTSVSIPNSVTSIGNFAFENCSGLTSVTIPNSVTSIGDNAFKGCSGLTSVTIGNSVTSIGNSAFRRCSKITDVYCYAEKVPSTNSNAFGSDVRDATLHVPAESIEDYKATTPWSGFGNIVALTEEEAAGVEEIEGEDANSNNAPVYNINGVKMQNADNLPKGIYIKNGKKYMVK